MVQIAVLMFVFGTTVLWGQTTPVPGSWRPVNPFPDEEAPPYLLDLDVGDTEVELFVLGSWVASSVVSTGLAIHPPLPDSGRRITWGHEYPDFETKLFDQTVDLTVSLWLYQRYFFEASFADDSDVNSIAAGYYAAEDELVQEFVIGNVPLAVSRYPYQYSGNSGTRAGRKPNPGTVLRLQTDRTFHEFLLQLENSTAERIRISGGQILEDATIRPEDYLRGRAFVLPDTQVGSVEVLLQDQDGSILGTVPGDSTPLRYRDLSQDAGDYVLDATTGLIRLSEGIPENRVVAVYYETANGRPVGDEANGTDGLVALDSETAAPTTGTVDFSFGSSSLFGLSSGDVAGDDYRMDLSDGRDALILRAPGLWSPFEAANLYRLPDGAGDESRYRLVRRTSRTPLDSQIELRRIPGTDLLTAVRGATERGIGYRYPWAEEVPRSTNARIYGPWANTEQNLAESEIFVEFGRSAERLILDGNVVPGSVVVTADGRSVAGATVDYGSGEVALPAGIADTGTVDITYRVYGEDGSTSDLVIINGNRWSPTEQTDVTLSTGMRWTLTENGYSTELNEHPGQITLSSGVTWEGDNLRLEAAGAAQVSQSDTTGFMRLFGSSVRDTRLSPDAETLFPPRAAPDLATRDNKYNASVLTEANRIYPRYRDHWSTDTLGNISLSAYPTRPEADTDRAGARIGPYVARSTDAGYSGTVGVLEWDELPAGTWTGARINHTGNDLDLRDATTISVTYRYIEDDGSGVPPVLLLEVGSLGEDLDGDGTADVGRSAVDPTIEFDGAAGERRAGQDAPGLSSPHREDANRNGVLDPEPASGVLSYVFEDPVSDAAGWRTVTIDIDPAERGRLSAVRAARLIAAAPGGSDVAAGRIVIGDISFRRTQSVTLTNPGANNSGGVSVVPDPQIGGASLRATQDVVDARFVPEEGDQRVIRLDWDNTDGDVGEVEAEFPIPDFSTRAYATLRGYFYLDAAVSGSAAETVTLEVSPYRNAPTGETIRATIPAERLAGGWHEVEINLPSGDLAVDGSRVSGGAEIGNKVEDVLLRIGSITVSGIGGGGVETGALYFDELHAADARTGFAVAGRLRADWSRTVETGPLAGTEFYVSQIVAAQGEDFQAAGSAAAETGAGDTTAEREVPGSGAVATESRAGLRRGHLHLEGDVRARESTNSTDTAFGHTVQAPLLPDGALIVRETFFRDYRTGTEGFQRGVSLTANAPSIGRYHAENRQTIGTFDAEQAWQLDVSPPEVGPFRLTVNSDAALFVPRFDLDSESYGDTWIRSNSYIAPLPAQRNPQERRHNSRSQLDIGPLKLGANAGWTNRSSLSGEQEHQLGLDTALELTFTPDGRRPWKLTPSYTRDYAFTEEVSSADFAADGNAWSSHVGAEPLVFTAPPVVELFAADGPGSVTPFEETGLSRSYESEGRIRFSRVFSSRVSDLWTPADVEALVQRSLRWEADTREDTRQWQLGITAIAINLFGRQGSTPTFGAYRSDEFRNAVILGLRESPGSDREPTWSIGLEQGSSFFGAGENRLDLLTTIDISGGAEQSTIYGHEAVYVWDRFRYPPLPVFEQMEEKPFYRHEERLTYEITTVEGEFTSSTLTVGHVTSLVITEQGSISLFGDLGWISDPGEYEDGALHLIGFRMGIEGRLSY